MSSAVDFTSTALLASIKRRAIIPDSQILYTDSDLLAIASEELRSTIAPLLMKVREEYMVTDYDQTIVSTQTAYRIPTRAIGQKLHDAVLLNPDGNEISMPRADPSQLKKQWMAGAYLAYANRTKFYFKDDQVILFPDASAIANSFSLRMKYYRRPNNLIATTDAAQITVIDATNKILTFASIPSTWTTSDVFDILKGTPSFRSWGDDLVITGITSTTMTFSAAFASGLAVGDWVARAGVSPVPQIPYEVHDLLAQRSACKVLEGLADQNGLASAERVYDEMIGNFLSMVSPRADDSPKRIVRSNSLWGGSRSPRWNQW